MTLALGLGLSFGRTGGVPSALRALGAPANATRGVNFLTGQYWRTSLVSMARNLAAYQANGSGVFTSFPVNTLRRSDSVGALIEADGTNHIRNNSMQGAVAGTSGTLPTNWQTLNFPSLTRTVVGVGTSLGIDYIDLRYAGTVGSTAGGQLPFESNTQIVAANGETWTNSAYLAIVGGTTAGVTSVVLAIAERTSAGASVTVTAGANVVTSLTSTLQRFSYTRTLAGGATVARARPDLNFGLTNGAAVDFTVRIGWPQMEQAASASSPIRTTAAAVTRPIDVPVLAASGTHNWTVVFDNDSTETFAGVSGDWTIDAAQLDRSTVKAAWAVAA